MNDNLVLPLSPENFKKVTQGFGVASKEYQSGVHNGTDFGIPVGTPAYAIASGYVSDVVRNHATLGNACFYTFMLDNVWYTARYLHLSSLPVEGQYFNAGDVLCHTGNTGLTSGPHLHLDIQKNTKVFDVYKILTRQGVFNSMENPYAFITSNLA